MASLPKTREDDCEAVDACVFSGDMLKDDEQRAAFKEYLDRWNREVARYDINAETQPAAVPSHGPDLEIRNPYRPSESWHEQAPPAAVPGLYPRTADLVQRFSDALAEKLAAAEAKYGYADNWAVPDWMDECRAKLVEHVAKGDPRDVAAYAAFLWHHGERTSLKVPPAAVPAGYVLIGHGFTADPYFQLCADEKALLASVTEMFGEEPADDGEDMAASITEELLATGKHHAEDGSLWLHRLAPPAALPDGYVLVPKRMKVTAKMWEVAQCFFHGPGMGEGEPFLDCLLWVGETVDDDDSKETRTYGLNIACLECLEEGSVPLVEFAPPAVVPASNPWRPIETAPTDGTSFLVYLPEEKRNPVQTAWQNKNGVMVIGSSFSFDLSSPTLWMPLDPMLAAAKERSV